MRADFSGGGLAITGTVTLTLSPLLEPYRCLNVKDLTILGSPNDNVINSKLIKVEMGKCITFLYLTYDFMFLKTFALIMINFNCRINIQIQECN